MKLFVKLFIFTASLTMLSCTKDFIVKDIKNETVVVLAPANNTSTPNNSITFWWEEMEGAEKYSLQIVKPNFLSAQQLVVDTNVVGNKFNFTFSPGTYQWRIKGVNGGGNSQYTTFNLTIDTTSNLVSQLVIPISPVNNHLSGTKVIQFSWGSLSAATNYQVQVFNSINAIVKDTSTTNTSWSTTLNSAGAYTWKVRAFNAFSISQYNTQLSFTVDLTPPSVSILLAPVNGASVKDTSELKWSRTSSDARYDSLYISSDSLFGSVLNSERVYASKIRINSLAATLPSTGGYYWWRLRTVDSVGNTSGYSSQLKFKLLP